MNKIKENLHTIIDSFNDEELLSAVYEILHSRQNQQSGKLWNTLRDDEKKAVVESSNNTNNPEKQISHAEMMEKNKKWLEE